MTINIQNDDDIYIDCNPIDIINENADPNSVSNNNNNNNFNNDEIINNYLKNQESINLPNMSDLSDNPIFQSIIGLFLLLFIYSIGNYIFKNVPKNIGFEDL